MFKSYMLNNNLPSLGIGREDFVSPFRAIIKSSSFYNGSEVYDLMKFNKETGDFRYKDEYVFIYDACKTKRGSSNYILIKSKEILTNNGISLHIQNIDIENCSKIEHLAYKISYDSSDKIFKGVFITPKCITDTLKKINQHNTEEKFLATNGFIVIEHINLDSIQHVFKTISKIPSSLIEKRF